MRPFKPHLKWIKRWAKDQRVPSDEYLKRYSNMEWGSTDPKVKELYDKGLIKVYK